MRKSEEKSIEASAPKPKAAGDVFKREAQADPKNVVAKASVPRKSSAERQRQILTELADLLGSKGAGRASTSELARKVGVTEPALYRHFDSKAQMLSALLDCCQTGIEAITSSGAEALASAGTFMEANPSVARLMAGDGLSGEGRDLVDRMESIWVSLGAKAYPVSPGLAQAGCDWLRGLMSRWVSGARMESAMGSVGAKAGLAAFEAAQAAEPSFGRPTGAGRGSMRP